MKRRTHFSGCVVANMITLIMLPALALAASDTGTLQVGHQVVLILRVDVCISGYASPVGSYSPTGLTGGETVGAIYDVNTVNALCSNFVSGHDSYFHASGFSTDPGQTWLTSVTCNGIAKTGASATYSYSSGTAIWAWSSDFSLRSIASGTNVSCTISHN